MFWCHFSFYIHYHFVLPYSREVSINFISEFSFNVHNNICCRLHTKLYSGKWQLCSYDNHKFCVWHVLLRVCQTVIFSSVIRAHVWGRDIIDWFGTHGCHREVDGSVRSVTCFLHCNSGIPLHDKHELCLEELRHTYVYVMMNTTFITETMKLKNTCSLFLSNRYR